jgi:hypothetical protein
MAEFSKENQEKSTQINSCFICVNKGQIQEEFQSNQCGPELTNQSERSRNLNKNTCELLQLGSSPLVVLHETKSVPSNHTNP